MLKKFGVVVVIFLLIGVGLAPSIHANSKHEPISEATIDSVNKIEKLEQRLLEFVAGVLCYVEQIYGPLPDEECGCDEGEETEWPFPIICAILYPAAILSWIMFYIPMLFFGPNWPGFIGAYFYMIMKNIGTTFNCKWADM